MLYKFTFLVNKFYAQYIPFAHEKKVQRETYTKKKLTLKEWEIRLKEKVDFSLLSTFLYCFNSWGEHLYLYN